MEAVLAPLDVQFTIEQSLESQSSGWVMPFENMDKSCEEECKIWEKTKRCPRGSLCPYRHITGEKSIVCKHWLKGLCKKGDSCEFLHRYDMRRMPECYFWTTFGECHNEECVYLHLDPEMKRRDCLWYARGFCKHGPECKNRHRKETICVNWLCGFCLDGKKCKLAHPRWEIPVEVKDDEGQIISTSKLPPTKGGPEQDFSGPTRSLDSVTCYKCGEKGHYANKCPQRGMFPGGAGPPRGGAGIPNTQTTPQGETKTAIVPVPNDKVGLIIGKGGSTFREIQEQSGARMLIPKVPEAGTDMRHVSVTGTQEQINLCEEMIQARVVRKEHSSAAPTDPNALTFKFPCPNDKIGLIIGKGGGTFREIQEQTGAKIIVPKAPVPGTDFREITIIGQPAQVEQCHQIIKDKITPRGNFNNQNQYPRLPPPPGFPGFQGGFGFPHGGGFDGPFPQHGFMGGPNNNFNQRQNNQDGANKRQRRESGNDYMVEMGS
eukprot:m.120349 g.120349  ORF g.120349 m.120349 type:complete len:489 (+) comp14356_c0_seq4:177-1643(+)